MFDNRAMHSIGLMPLSGSRDFFRKRKPKAYMVVRVPEIKMMVPSCDMKESYGLK